MKPSSRSDNPKPGAGEKSRSSLLRIDGVDPEDKVAWVMAAQKAKLRLKEWVEQELNRASGKKS